MLQRRNPHRPRALVRSATPPRWPLLAGALALALAGAVALSGWAGQAVAADDATAAARSALEARLETARPGLGVKTLVATPVPGLFQATLTNGQLVHATADGRYLVAGDLLELREDGVFSLTELARNAERKELLADVAMQDMVVFHAVGEPKAVINVFTDVDCGFCQKLHREVPDMNAMGIEVRYLAFPRGYARFGEEAESFVKIRSAWCAEDRQTAITRLKQGQPIAEAECAAPVAQQYEIGVQMGVRGTPALVTSDGRLLPGYMPAADLAAELGVDVPEGSVAATSG